MFRLPESIHTATPTMDATLATAKHVSFIGQRVTAQRRTCLPGDAEWIIIGWQDGLPVATKPVTTARVQDLISRYDHTLS